MIHAYFSSDHSLGSSVLTIDKETEIKDNKSVSILAIAKTHGENPFLVVEENISSYWQLYRNCAALDLQFAFGIKMTVCADMEDKTDESRKTESNVIILFKNSESYYKIIPLYSSASVSGFLKYRRTDWKSLNKFWTDDFALALPFYSSFIARNLTRYDRAALPEFGAITPTFFLEDHGLPFDALITKGVQDYAKSAGYPIQEAHQCYYYRNDDVMNLLTIKAMRNRRGAKVPTWEAPNLEHFGSDQFSYESYLHRIGKKL